MTENTWKIEKEGYLLALICFLAYWLSFKVNVALDPWFRIMPGVSLIFLPAGVKLVAIMVADRWGLIGIGLAGLWMATDVWTESTLLALAGNIVIWIGVPYLVVRLVMRVLGVRDDLANLSYMHMVQIDIAATFANAFTSSVYAIWVHGRSPSELLSSSVGMMVGDFVGSGVMLALLALIAAWLPRDKRN